MAAAGHTLADRLAAVRGRIDAAAERSGRDAHAVRILAVTKGHPASVITDAAEAGLRDIGESRVQEAGAKRAALPDLDARWHLVGHLQRNKARRAAGVFDAVHSIDSLAVARELDRHREGHPPLEVLVEVDFTGMARRTGVSEAEAGTLLMGLTALRRLHVTGLMTVAAPGPLTEASATFARLRVLRDRLVDEAGMGLPELSMGMSEDFEAAVAEGATIVRLGRVLFGDRPAGAAGERGYPQR